MAATGIVACESFTQRTPRARRSAPADAARRGMRGSLPRSRRRRTPTRVAASAAPSMLASMWRPGSGTSRCRQEPLPATMSHPSSSTHASTSSRPGRSSAIPRHACGQSLAQIATPGIVDVEYDPAARRASARRGAPSPRGTRPPCRVDRDGPRRCSCRAPRRHRGRWSAAGARRARARPSRRTRARRPLDQRRADVAAEDRRQATRLEHGGHQRGGRRLALRPGHREDPRAGQAQEQLDLADDLGAARLGGTERLAQPRVGRREAGRDRRAGDQQVGAGEDGRRGAFARPSASRTGPSPERSDGVRQLRGRAAVVGGDVGARIGQEAAGGDAGPGQAEDDGSTAAEVGEGPDRRRIGAVIIGPPRAPRRW